MCRKLNPGLCPPTEYRRVQQRRTAPAALQHQSCIPTSPSFHASTSRFKHHLRHLQRLLSISGHVITNREGTKPQTYLCIKPRCSLCECVVHSWYIRTAVVHKSIVLLSIHWLLIGRCPGVLMAPWPYDMSEYQLGLDRSCWLPGSCDELHVRWTCRSFE